MTNPTENKLDQMKQDLNDIETNAKSLDINDFNEKIEDDKLILTDIVKKINDSEEVISNNEILLELGKLQSSLDLQKKILSDLIKKIY